jgi:hypothetical protein
MSTVDPWQKACECALAVKAATDPQQRATLVSLRDFWISLANARNFTSTDELAKEIDAVGRLQIELTAADGSAAAR